MVRRSLAVSSLALALAVGPAGCNFAVKHPAATAGIAGGGIGFGTCALESDHTSTCAIIGASTAAFMFAVAYVAIWAMGGDDDDHLIVDPALANPEDGPSDIPVDQRGDIDAKATRAAKDREVAPGGSGSGAPAVTPIPRLGVDPVVAPAPTPPLPAATTDE